MNFRFSDSSALSDGNYSVSAKELLTNAKALAARLQEAKLSRIGLLAGNSLGWVTVDLACLIGDVCLVPIPTFFSNKQRDHVVDTCALSTDCRGGGKQSNMHLLPQLVRLAVHQVALAPEKGLEEFHALLDRLCSPEETWEDDDASGHVLPAALVLTVITWTSGKWSAARRNALISNPHARQI